MLGAKFPNGMGSLNTNCAAKMQQAEAAEGKKLFNSSWRNSPLVPVNKQLSRFPHRSWCCALALKRWPHQRLKFMDSFHLIASLIQT